MLENAINDVFVGTKFFGLYQGHTSSPSKFVFDVDNMACIANPDYAR